MRTQILVDPGFVERHIMKLGEYGACEETGVRRTVYSPEWVGAQDQIAAWCREAGLEVRRDAVGNVWGRLEGTDGGPSIVSGSHIDSQCPGGRYDGALGVLAGLIALRTLKETFGRPKRTLEMVSFCEEECSRFQDTYFWGSRAVLGLIEPGEVDTIIGFDGKTIGQAMREVGLDPARVPEAVRKDVDTFIELHIEQGPILEQAGLPVGIVTAINGIREYVLEVTGRVDHAGGMPMDLRRDPMAGAAEMISGIVGNAVSMGRPAVTTVGRVVVEPNFSAIVPGRVTFTIDARHPDPGTWKELCRSHERLIAAVAERRGLQASLRITGDLSPCLSNPALVSIIEEAAREQGIPAMRIQSGAVHDTMRMATIARVAMIFVQSKGGRSHSPAEYTLPDHAAAGIEVLAATLHRLAY